MEPENLEEMFFGPLSDEERAAIRKKQEELDARFRAEDAAREARYQKDYIRRRRISIAILVAQILAWSLYGYTNIRKNQAQEQQIDDFLGCIALTHGVALPEEYKFPLDEGRKDTNSRRMATTAINHCEETWDLEPTRSSIRHSVRASLAAGKTDIPKSLVKDSEWSPCKAAGGCGSLAM